MIALQKTRIFYLNSLIITAGSYELPSSLSPRHVAFGKSKVVKAPSFHLKPQAPDPGIRRIPGVEKHIASNSSVLSRTQVRLRITPLKTSLYLLWSVAKLWLKFCACLHCKSRPYICLSYFFSSFNLGTYEIPSSLSPRYATFGKSKMVKGQSYYLKKPRAPDPGIFFLRCYESDAWIYNWCCAGHSVVGLFERARAKTVIQLHACLNSRSCTCAWTVAPNA